MSWIGLYFVHGLAFRTRFGFVFYNQALCFCAVVFLFYGDWRLEALLHMGRFDTDASFVFYATDLLA